MKLLYRVNFSVQRLNESLLLFDNLLQKLHLLALLTKSLAHEVQVNAWRLLEVPRHVAQKRLEHTAAIRKRTGRFMVGALVVKMVLELFN